MINHNTTSRASIPLPAGRPRRAPRAPARATGRYLVRALPRAAVQVRPGVGVPLRPAPWRGRALGHVHPQPRLGRAGHAVGTGEGTGPRAGP